MHPICALKWMSGCENVWAGETGERSKTKHPLPIVLSSRFPNTNQVSSNMCWTSSGLASIRPHRACVYSLYIKLRGSLLQYFGGQLVTLCRLWVPNENCLTLNTPPCKGICTPSHSLIRSSILLLWLLCTLLHVPRLYREGENLVVIHHWWIHLSWIGLVVL